MQVKWSAVAGTPEDIQFVDESTISVNGAEYELQSDAVQYPDIVHESGGVIVEAHRENGELYLTVVRHWLGGGTADWDDGLYHPFPVEE